MTRLLLFTLTFCLSISLNPVAKADDKRLMPYQLHTEDMQKAIGERLVAEGIAEQVDVKLLAQGESIIHASKTPFTVEIKTLTLDKPRSRFSGDIFLVSQGKVEKALPIKGRYDIMVTLPVLKQKLTRGEIIDEKYIAYESFPENRVRGEIIREKKDIIGKAVSGSISAYRPIRDHELSAPMLINRNQLVEMRFNTGTMFISTTGMSLEEGAIGDIIQVRNVNSKHVVRGIINKDGSLEVVPLTQTTQLMR